VAYHFNLAGKMGRRKMFGRGAVSAMLLMGHTSDKTK